MPPVIAKCSGAVSPTPSADIETLPSSVNEGGGEHSESGVLFVDLDGTLVATDLLHEMIWQYIASSPGSWVRLPLWLMGSRERLKSELSRCTTLDATTLPYRQEILTFLESERAAGRSIVLATATHETWAHQVASHLGHFDAVLATDDTRNLKGTAKLKAMESYCLQNEIPVFGYVGDCRADLPIWSAASDRHVVSPSAGLLRSLRRAGGDFQVLKSRPPLWRAVLRSLRPHHWAKNLLIFVPLVVGHHLTDLSRVLSAVLAFVAFSACCSAIYVLNDLFDIGADRRHPRKKSRPFASGELPVRYGPVLFAAALATAFGIAGSFLPISFTLTLFAYLGATCAYSLWIKRIMMADIIVLALLYASRVLAGGYAANVLISEWLLTFSLFIFASLAFLKRYSELLRLSSENQTNTVRRGYSVSDLAMIESMGTVSGFLSVLVLALYLQSPAVHTLYPAGRLLWALCPILMYWVGRAWMLARRRQLGEDPVVFAVTDPISLCLSLTVCVVLWAASR